MKHWDRNESVVLYTKHQGEEAFLGAKKIPWEKKLQGKSGGSRELAGRTPIKRKSARKKNHRKAWKKRPTEGKEKRRAGNHVKQKGVWSVGCPSKKRGKKDNKKLSETNGRGELGRRGGTLEQMHQILEKEEIPYQKKTLAGEKPTSLIKGIEGRCLWQKTGSYRQKKMRKVKRGEERREERRGLQENFENPTRCQ